MPYTNRHIFIKFDGTQINECGEHEKDDNGKYVASAYDENGQLKPIYYPNLGDDVWISVRNPMIMPTSLLMPSLPVAVDSDGKPLKVHDAIDAGNEVAASLIVDWNLDDPLDDSGTPAPLRNPADFDKTERRATKDENGEWQGGWVGLMRRCPRPITDAISELVQRARNPH